MSNGKVWRAPLASPGNLLGSDCPCRLSLVNIYKMQKPQVIMSNRKGCRVGASFAHPWFRVLPLRPTSCSSKNCFTFSKLSFSWFSRNSFWTNSLLGAGEAHPKQSPRSAQKLKSTSKKSKFFHQRKKKIKNLANNFWWEICRCFFFCSGPLDQHWNIDWRIYRFRMAFSETFST